MAHAIYWYIPQRVFVLQLWGKVDLDELQTALDEALQRVNEGTAPIHCIADVRSVTYMPKNLHQIQKMAKLFRHPNMGWLLTLNDDRVLNLFASVITQVSQVQYRAFQRSDDLLNTLAHIDDTLPELPPYVPHDTVTIE